ncbi:MAG TPA: peptidoglycan bridge formation glycyltransferase FemA/FemB family protein [Candidatus Limnocylindria bacterium]|nr:peptidoglycan bridge formation glycyltransferase FemA/FemB family protein [Candidatus Limnocylindria bacterium]
MAGARVRPATDADRAAWDAFVSEREDGDLLQSWAWGECQRLVGEAPMRLLAEAADGSVRGVAQALVRAAGFGRSVAYVAHGPVWQREAPDGDRLLGALLDGLRQASRADRVIVVKLDPRAVAGAGDVVPRLESYGLRRAPDLQAPTTRIVDLADGGEQLMASWHADARRLSRRSKREGVEVQIDREGDPTALQTLHELLTVTAERHAFRVRTPEFLARLAEQLVARDGWYLGLARADGAPIAAMAMPRFGPRAYYLYGASLREERYKHKYGAYAVMAALQKQLAADGVRTLDMWGVVEPDDATADPGWHGFSAFKRTFGGDRLRHPGTFDLVIDPLWYRLRELRARIVRR